MSAAPTSPASQPPGVDALQLRALQEELRAVSAHRDRLRLGAVRQQERIDALERELVARGAEVSEVQVLDWGSFVYFSDPDGNSWALQQLPAR